MNIKLNGLGKPLGEFRSRSDFLRVFLPVMLISIGLLVWLVLLPWIVTFTKEPNLFVTVLILLAGLGLAGWGGYLAVLNSVEGNWQVRAFEEGTLLTYKGENKVLRWSEIASVEERAVFTFTFVFSSVTYRVYTIWMQNGEKHTFSGVKVQQLGNLIRRQWERTG